MEKRTLKLGALALLLGAMGALTGTAFAYQGDPSVRGPNYSAERHASMEKAFESKDYTAWKNLMPGRGRVMQVVNKDNFAKFAEAHELAEQGKFTEAQKIRQEMGLGLHDGLGKKVGGMGRGMMGR